MTNEPAPEPPVRVAFFSDALPERNGTGAYYHDLLAHLRPRVAAAAVMQPAASANGRRLSLRMPGDATQELVVPNVPRIRRDLRVLQPNLIVTVTPGPFGLLGLREARRRGCGFISAYHTDFEGLSALYWGRLRAGLIQGVMDRVNRFICRRSGTVIGHSEGLRERLNALGAPRVDILGTPLDARFLAEPPAPPEHLGRVCYAGRLAAEKNPQALIDAARRHPGIDFVIVGDGPERALMEAAASELPNLDYRGWLERESLRAVMDSADLLVLPSHMETFGSVALEAMARARPALVSAQAGITQWPGLAAGLFTQAACPVA
ncbi:MAG: glycosyltransferase, partial [Ectothiorhodospiraceae bacterium]